MSGIEDYALGFVSAFALIIITGVFTFWRNRNNPALRMLMRALDAKRKQHNGAR